MRRTVASFALLLTFALPSARAISSHDDQPIDAAGLAQLEQRAEHAEAREQAFLFTELVQLYTTLVGKQIAAGEMEDATATLKRIEHCAVMVHSGIAKDTKKVKNAEMMMQTATFHLTQAMRLASTDDQETVKSTLHQLQKVHDELLAQVFAH